MLVRVSEGYEFGYGLGRVRVTAGVREWGKGIRTGMLTVGG